MDYCNSYLPWQLEGDEYLLQKDVNFDLSQCEWNDIAQNGENIFYTPVKAYADAPYHFNDRDIITKNLQESEDLCPPAKRRRMLDFKDIDGEIFSSTTESKERNDAIDEFVSEISQWEMFLSDDLSPSSFDDLNQSDSWFADCLDATSVNINSNGRNGYVSSDILTGQSEICSNALDSAHNVAQQTVRSSDNAIFRGIKTYMRLPPKQGSTIVYPFEFIKPCSLRGEVTLKDINDMLQSPKPKQVSAFSGKRVVGKTKISTQGGEGSITIMRTQG